MNRIDNELRCQWDQCSKMACHHVFTEDGKHSAYLCGFHRRVALINLEQFGMIRAPAVGANVGPRPGNGPPPIRPIQPTDRPQKPKEEPWEQRAAKAADNAATELQPKKKLGNLPKK